MKKKLFLLGGYDLEMVTIRDVLLGLEFVDITDTKDLSQEKCFADKNLKWGAKVEDYAEYLGFEGTIYGIELTETEAFKKPDNYVRIDHHNDYACNPSSLVQVCTLLNVKLISNLILIAANDSGYIPAMKALGASQEEIEAIRFADRKAQGVTQKDEELAVESVKNIVKRRGVLIVKSLTTKFATITDRLYPYEKLLVYNDMQFVYYGTGVRKLAEKFKPLIAEKKLYFGGGNNGFLGSDENAFNKQELDSIIKDIIKIVE